MKGAPLLPTIREQSDAGGMSADNRLPVRGGCCSRKTVYSEIFHDSFFSAILGDSFFLRRKKKVGYLNLAGEA